MIQPRTDPWTIGSLSRRTRRRGMILSALTGLATLGFSVISHTHAARPVPVVLARLTLPAGTYVTAADLTTATLPAPGIAQAVTTPRAVIGHRLTLTVAAGQPLVRADVAATPSVHGLSPGEVALMLPVSLASSDNVKPNDRVEVIWVGANNTSAPNAGPSVPAGTVLAQGLRVLAVLNQNGGPVQPPGATGLNASTPAAVEVAVPASEAGRLAVAAASGRFWLAQDPWAGPGNGGGGPVPDWAPTSVAPAPSAGSRSAAAPSRKRAPGGENRS